MIPFEAKGINPFEEKNNHLERYLSYVDQIKKQARYNLNTDAGYLRIAWVHKYKRPLHDHYLDYTDEQMLLESWEQFYFENPDHLDVKGIEKKKSTKGLDYYQCGDPVIDKLEQAFANGETPDLAEAFKDLKKGKDIFRERLFEHEHGEKSGMKIAPKGDIISEKIGEHEEGNEVISHDDYSSEDFLKQAAIEDPILKDFMTKAGLNG